MKGSFALLTSLASLSSLHLFHLCSKEGHLQSSWVSSSPHQSAFADCFTVEGIV